MEKLFGRSYESIGNGTSDLILKTRGQVKVKWGEKYIDLIKDGKVAVDSIAIKKVSEVPTKKGIYITEDGNIYISDGTNSYNIFGETGITYVSFVGKQEVSAEQRIQALQNIGLIFTNEEEFSQSGIQNGIVYITDSQEFYKVVDGSLESISGDFSSTITEPLTIDVSGSALIINDNGTIDIGDFSISKNGINSSNAFSLSIKNSNIIKIESSNVTVNKPINTDTLISKNIQSTTLIQDDLSGQFRMYINSDGDSSLEIDKIILSKGIEPKQLTFMEFTSLVESEDLLPGTSYTITDFQNEWELREEPILEDSQSSDENGNPIYVVIETGEQISDPDVVDSYDSDELQPVIEEYKTVHPLIVTAVATNQISSTAIMVDNPQWIVQYDPTYQDIIKSYPAITEGENTNTDSEYYNSETGNIELTAKGRIIKLTDEFNNTCNYDFKHLRYWYDNSWHYTFDNSGVDASLTGNIKNCTILDQNYQISGDLPTGQYDGEGNEITSRIIIRDGCQIVLSGNISDITANNLINCTLYGEINNSTFHGNISNQTITSTELLANPNKVKDIYYDGGLQILCIPDLLSPPMPTGAIISYNGTDIPDGWALCDGSNGTPDLRDKFIVGGDSVGEGAELLSTATSDESYTLSYYKLIFIIKL